ncbi:MAG: molybdopterin molybdenumtransferase MoeA [Alphaproteobacteria bacterium]|nr:molybdopterin molybdenumtransferase MoeA [Alphaproteobacteria bacterium]
MISVEEAVARALAGFRPLPAEQVGLDQARGRVLAEPVRARVTKPPVAVSAMDGYAVRAADLPATLRVVASIAAGAAYDGVLGPGESARIFTGAPMPKGADAVLIQEDAAAAGDRVTARAGIAPGRHVRKAGLDFRAGDVGLEAGRRLGPREIGLAAAMNVPWLRVHRRPRVAILGTGNEIVMPGDPLGPNQIVSSNSLALAALVEDAGGVPYSLGIARDDADSLRAHVAAAAGADLLVITGGASVGEHDLVRPVLERDGLTLDFWKIAMRPGKPLMFGSYRGTPTFGLPGNPVSTVVCGLLFVQPAIWAMAGDRTPRRDRLRAVLARDLPANDDRQDYLRARLVDGTPPLVDPLDIQDSSMMATLAKADCLAVRPPRARAAKAGESIEVILL